MPNEKTNDPLLIPALLFSDVVVDGEVQFSEAREETWKSIREVEASVERTRAAIATSKGAVEKCAPRFRFSRWLQGF